MQTDYSYSQSTFEKEIEPYVLKSHLTHAFFSRNFSLSRQVQKHNHDNLFIIYFYEPTLLLIKELPYFS